MTSSYDLMCRQLPLPVRAALSLFLFSNLVYTSTAVAGELVIDQNSKFSSLIVDVVAESKDFAIELEQGGEANNLEMTVDSALSGSISQVGVQGTIDLNSVGETQNLTVSQAGVSNIIGLELFGSALAVLVDQSGSNNSIDYSSNGNGNSGDLTQSGNDNQIVLSQAGSDNIATLVQQGSNNQMNVAQHGGGLVLDITQIGNGDTLIVE